MPNVLGGGDVAGPASATDNAVARFDGTTGKLIQNSAVTISDTTGDIAGATSLTAPASTDLTLAGGSSGASLVLGPGVSNTTTLTTVGHFTNNISGASKSFIVSSLNQSNLSDFPNALIWTTDSMAIDKGGFLGFGGAYTGTSQTIFAGIMGRKENGTGGNIAGYLSFAVTNSGGTNTEAARITSTRNLLIGTTSETGLTGAGGLKVASTTAGASNAGALIVAGGLSAAGVSYFGGNTTINGILFGNSQIVGPGGSAGSPTFTNGNGQTGFWTNANTSANIAVNTVNQLSITSTTATFAGAVTIAGTVIHTLSATPASASATGTVGTMSWDASYIYICTAANTWKRVAIATW